MPFFNSYSSFINGNQKEKMSHLLPDSSITLFIGLGFILLVVCGILACTIWTSIRLCKVEPPKLKFLFAMVFLQILLGGLTVFGVKSIKNDPLIDIGTGVGITFLSGILFIKLILKNGWKKSLRVWAVATGMQLVFVPVCSMVMAVGWVRLLLLLYPPQF
jgi:hypothetical protein